MKRTIVVSLLGMMLCAAPAGAFSKAECSRAWKEALQMCLLTCSRAPAGIAARRCRSACKNPRVKRIFLKECQSLGTPS
jgi:hypothetical protein